MKRDIYRDLARGDGIMHRSQLLALGHSPGALGYAARTGRVRVIRRRWVVMDGAPANAVRALELGGRLGGASALRTYGVWVDDSGLVISHSPHASRLPPIQGDERRIFVNENFPYRGDRLWRVSLEDAIVQLAHFEPDL